MSLPDGKGNVALLSWFSKKCLRVVPSFQAGEVNAAVTAFDLAFALQHTLEPIFGRKFELYLYTDSYSKFSTITKFQSIREKRLLIDLSVLRHGYRSKNIYNVGFVNSEEMIADPLTKPIINELLLQAMDSGRLEHDV